MNDFLGVSATAWTAVGSLAGMASLLIAVLIAVFVQIASSRAAKAARQIDSTVAELSRRGRRDDLFRQLRDERDADHLLMLIVEGRTLAAARAVERMALEKAYFTNPASPLLSYQEQLPSGLTSSGRRQLLHAVIDALPARYAALHVMPPQLGADLARLVRLAIDLDVATHPVAAFLMDRAADDWLLDDTTIRRILHPEVGYGCPPNPEAASDFLDALMHRDVGLANLVNVVAGVSLAICDFRSEPNRYAPLDTPFVSYIMLMQRKLGRLGEQPVVSDATIGTDHAAALMVHALGLGAGQDRHLNMRALESLIPLLASFPADRFTSSGIVAGHLASGVAALLQVPAPEELRQRLRSEALRLAPSIEPRLPELVA